MLQWLCKIQGLVLDLAFGFKVQGLELGDQGSGFKVLTLPNGFRKY